MRTLTLCTLGILTAFQLNAKENNSVKREVEQFTIDLAPSEEALHEEELEYDRDDIQKIRERIQEQKIESRENLRLLENLRKSREIREEDKVERYRKEMELREKERREREQQKRADEERRKREQERERRRIKRREDELRQRAGN